MKTIIKDVIGMVEIAASVQIIIIVPLLFSNVLTLLNQTGDILLNALILDIIGIF